ncbi:WecB/TagA/CpsF family glycosyltransferase [Desulfosarcina sp.]|uniref:WecB/TagA/CpsF family glycosyltransferase n=1 Tax=Desulfosarcina sp. TaxID=2027861 RepID=UPI0039709B5B
MKDRLKILDIWVDPVDRAQAIERVRGFLHGDRPCSIFAANPEKNFSVPKDPQLWDAFKAADLLIPDGIGIVVAARLLHGAVLQRVPGVEFMQEICRLAVEEDKSIFIYGARDDVNQAAVEQLRIRFPAIRIAGRSHGYVPEEQMAELVRSINDSGAAILFLALGSPRQEKWFAAHASELTTVKVCQGIGGTLDAITGSVKRAPDIWMQLSLEWLYRLLTDPRRIHRQRVLPIFALRVLMAMAKSNQSSIRMKHRKNKSI